MRGIFFTGTDTGVGKTLVTAAVVRLLRRQGRRFRVCKPVATGAAIVVGRWLCMDSVALAAAAEDDPGRVTPYVFREPASPPVAARAEDKSLQLADLERAVREASADTEAVLVEGVGGLLCPLTERETVADLIGALNLPTVIVARRSLGTLNHTLLTVEVAQARGLKLAGVVVNEVTAPASLAEQLNVEELTKRLSIPVLAVVPHQAPGAPAPQDALAPVDWWSICEM
jgi:dethiobiotin synthetase